MRLTKEERWFVTAMIERAVEGWEQEWASGRKCFPQVICDSKIYHLLLDKGWKENRTFQPNEVLIAEMTKEAA